MIFTKHKSIPGPYLFEKLKANGILVRHFSKPEIINDYLRISIGTDEEMNKMLDVLKEIINSYR